VAQTIPMIVRVYCAAAYVEDDGRLAEELKAKPSKRGNA
jgi:hypothetical protein